MKLLFYNTIILLILYTGCKSKEATPSDTTEATSITRTPVTIANPIDTVQINDDINLTALATYLLSSDVKANTTGYITKMSIKLADRVHRGQLLFSLQTKEAKALGNTINELDPSFRFSGNTTVISPSTGYVAMLNHQIGDYVQDGEVLATITDASSFGFVLNVPYEYNQLIKNNKNLIVNLPDGRNLTGYVAKIMPTLDSVSQTQKVLIKVNDKGEIPENLIANIKLYKTKMYGLTVPKAAVLSNDTQSEFWIMKLINDSTAVKTVFEKGIENEKWVQVKSGSLSVKDRIIISGNYGLADTALVKIEK